MAGREGRRDDCQHAELAADRGQAPRLAGAQIAREADIGGSRERHPTITLRLVQAFPGKRTEAAAVRIEVQQEPYAARTCRAERGAEVVGQITRKEMLEKNATVGLRIRCAGPLPGRFECSPQVGQVQATSMRASVRLQPDLVGETRSLGNYFNGDFIRNGAWHSPSSLLTVTAMWLEAEVGHAAGRRAPLLQVMILRNAAYVNCSSALRRRAVS